MSTTITTAREAENLGFWERILSAEYPRPAYDLSHVFRVSYMEGAMGGDDLLEAFGMTLTPISEEVRTIPIIAHVFDKVKEDKK